MSDQPLSSTVHNAVALQRLRENGIHSVFDVVREGRTAFISRLAGTAGEAEAKQLYDLAAQRASGLVRLHMSLVSRDEPTTRALPKLASGGSRERIETFALDEGGDFESWFGHGGLYPGPDSVASLFSPASYLVDLYRVAKKLHATSSDYHIDNRRPDLHSLTLSQDRMNTELPTLALVNEILSAGIEASESTKDTADEHVARAIYPFGLPYDARAAEISLGLRSLGLDELGIRRALRFPGESVQGETGLQIGAEPAADHAQEFTQEVIRAHLDLSPLEFALLTGGLDAEAAQLHWGGATLPITTATSLVELSGLSLGEIHELIGTERALKDSDNSAVSAQEYGASYVNRGLTGSPPKTLDLVVSVDDDDPYGTLEGATRWQSYEYAQRLIRLKPHIPLTFEEIDWIFSQSPIDDPVPALRAITTFLLLREKVDLSVDMFAGIIGRLNPYARAGKQSFIARLFGPAFSLHLNASVDFGSAAPSGHDTILGRITKGLGIDARTLHNIAMLISNKPSAPSVTLVLSEELLASLFRVVQIPRLAGFTVDEGLALWSCMEPTPDAIIRQLASAFPDRLFQAAQNILVRTIAASDWLRERKLDIPTLMALVTKRHRTTATVEILQFISNLHNSNSGSEASEDLPSAERPINDQLARHVGAQFSLTAGVARAMIHWIDHVIDRMDSDLKDYSSLLFWEDVVNLDPASPPASLDNIGSKPVKYCHVLGQFALACHLTGLQEQDIAHVIAPSSGDSKLYQASIPALDLPTIFWLFAYAVWRDKLPMDAAEARLHIGSSAINPPAEERPRCLFSHFAELNGWDPDLATGVWQAMGNGPESRIAFMSNVSRLSDWMSVAANLDLSPEKLKELRNLTMKEDLSTVTEERESLAPAILTAARSKASQSKWETIEQALVERRRDALLRYYIHSVVPSALKPTTKTPDDLYEYMLIDPQVSAKVNTSRIAEAISGVQLYLHRCREGLEPEVIPGALASEMQPGGYFAYWDAYNKRYGTWAGLQRLLRYPASYLDPSLRYVKTTPFRALEDALAQGRLTSERANDAFVVYVDAIREALDIDYIDGHQTGGSPDSPILFLGRNNDSPARYFWRRVSPTPMENPTAWSEWKPVNFDIPEFATPGEQPSIISFYGAPQVVGWKWKMTSVSAVEPKEGSKNVALEEDIQLYLCVSALRNDETWKTFNYAIAWTDPALDLARISTLRDGPVEKILFFAPRVSDPYLAGAERTVDRFYAAGPGPLSTSVLLGKPTTSDMRIVHGTFMECRAPLGGRWGSATSIVMYTFIEYNRFKMELSMAAPEAGLSIDFYFGDQVMNLDFGRMEVLLSKWKIIDIPEGVTKVIVNKSSGEVELKLQSFWCEPRPAWLLSHAAGWPCYSILFTQDLSLRDLLSSAAGPMLQERARIGIDTLLSYATQTMPVEPDGKRIRWNGGPGAYIWELFFHAPFLIACRLLDEQRFDEAETWLRRIFSPSGYVNADGALDRDELGNTRYWNVVPLQEDTTWGPITSAGTDDPDDVAMADPMHYKLAVYLRWMQLYMDRGDMAYRQQTRDTLTEAKMWYMQASQLLGRRPYFHNILSGYWHDPSLETAALATAPALEALEAIVGRKEIPLVQAHLGQIRVVDGVFRPPVDDGSLVWWDRFAQRLYNLRHGLSLDGQPLLLPLYETPVSPRDLQQRRLAADGGAQTFDPQAIPMPAQRFPLLLDRAKVAVQQLMQFGAALQGILERRDADALAVLQQTQQTRIQTMAKDIHAFQLHILEDQAEGLQVSRAQAADRQSHYAQLVSQNMNSAEIASMAMRTTAPVLLHQSVGAVVSAMALDMLPNTWIAGMAAGVGGVKFSAVTRAVAEGLVTEANALEMSAGTLDMVAEFQRRREEWSLQANQAALDVAQLDTQINANKSAIEQAVKQATQVEMEQGFSQAVLDTLTTRFTGKDLFGWQSGRMSSLYYQLYDATFSMCTWTQGAYQFETGDGTTFLQPGAWDDRYQGLLAGESLTLGLQRLERAYLTWDQRALEVERTLSLAALASEPLGELIGTALDTAPVRLPSGKLTIDYTNNVLSLSFTLSDAGIATDYPAEMQLGTRRRIKSIAITLPAVLGAYEDVRAVLGYAGGVAASLASGCTAVAVSRGIVDNGLFMLDFNDGKYLPFEGIPVDDNGTLSVRFPNAAERPQEDMLRSVNDVILHVRYTVRRDE